MGNAQKELFSEITVGPHRLDNRVVMAPMTRSRAGAGNTPDDNTELYYRQRSSAGLIITEATQVSQQGVGYPHTPGIHSDEQVEAWKRVVDAVHSEGGTIYLQLWHVGRISHSMYHDGEPPVSASAIQPAGQVYTGEGMQPFPTPLALGSAEIPGVVEQYRAGAANAKRAGFDGVEIHAANGYLIDQFLRSASNQRTDQYGGRLDNRLRFLVEVTEAVIGEWGADRVGVRLAPLSKFNDMDDADPKATFTGAAGRLSELKIGYLHMVEQDDYAGDPRSFDIGLMREAFGGMYMANGGYDLDRAQEAIRDGRADLVSFARLFLANPDLPRRFREDAPLNEPDPETFYGGDERGYTDYPALDEVAVVGAG